MTFLLVRYFTFLGNIFPQACVCLALCFVDLNKALHVGAIWGFAYLLNLIIKNTVRKERPAENLRRVRVHGYSFASGHALTSFAMYMSIAKYFDVAAPWVYLLYALPIALGLSRLYLRVHFPEDVLGGWIIAYMHMNFFANHIDKFADFIFVLISNFLQRGVTP